MIDKIKYEEKHDNFDNPVTGYVLASDLNEIKIVVNNLVDSANNGNTQIIDDNNVVPNKTWSSKKIDEKFDLVFDAIENIPLIDDLSLSVNKTWSSEKINRELQNYTPYSFEIINAIDSKINIVSGGIKVSTITTDITIDASSATPGITGKLLVIVDDEGNHIVNYADGNVGDKIPTNSLPRAETEFSWYKTNKKTIWNVKIISEGIEQTTIPTISLDNYFYTLEVFHFEDDSEILMSVNGGPWIQYPGKFNVDQVDRPAGYWQFKIKEGVDRIESKVAFSLPLSAIRRGFPEIIPVLLH